MSRRHSPFESFRYAFDGIKEALVNEPNFRAHILFGSIALVVGMFLKLTQSEWIALAFTIAFVLVLELFNTAIEAIVDHLSPKRHPKAKVAKDVSAAAVLVAAMLSILVAFLIFIPKLQALLK